MTEPTLGEMLLLIRETRDDVRDIREAVFIGHDGQEPILSRLATLEERTEKVEGQTRGAPMWTGIGSGVGAAIVDLLGYFGIKPPGQGQ